MPKTRPPLTIVIMDLPHRQASTDLDRLDDAISDAEKNYTAQGLEVVFYRRADDAINILYRHESLIARHKKILSDEVAKIYDRLYELDYLYDDFLMDCEDAGGCLNLSALNALCSFETARLSGRNSLWEAYNDAALKKLFPAHSIAKGNLNDLAQIYSYILAGELAEKNSLRQVTNQNVENGKRELLRGLKENFLSFMTAGRFLGKISPYEIRDIVSYKKLTSDRSGRFYGINAQYQRQLRQFVAEEARKILRYAIDSHINFFERSMR